MFSFFIGNVEQISEVKSYIHCPDFGDVGMMNPIETLPQELFLHICSFLKYYDVVSVGSTCRKLKKSIEDVALWRRIAKVELVNFEDTSIEPPSTSEIQLAVYLASHRSGEFFINNLLIEYLTFN